MNLSDTLVVEDTCGKYGIPSTTATFVEDDDEELPNSVDLYKESRLVVSARYPMYARIEERLETFKNWPKSLKQKPKELAEAGFFYINVGDKTVCFCCGVGCKFWEEHDVPWEEHAKWSPNCTFLLLKKGNEFVNRIKRKETECLLLEHTEAAVESDDNKKVITDKEGATAENKILCKVCLDKEMGVVFRPCGHSACVECALALKNCHICRSQIDEFIRIFIS